MTGENGLDVDRLASFRWFATAAQFNYVPSITACGVALMHGHGTEKCETSAALYLGMASSMGSEHACYVLGTIHASETIMMFCGERQRRGRGFKQKNEQKALMWYTQMQRMYVKDSTPECREIAKKYVANLQRRDLDAPPYEEEP